jgi:mRNA interferase MazF
MRRGEIRMVDLEPVRGSEADKRRPCVIVSNDGANRVAERLGRGVVTVVPVTTNVENIYPFQIALSARDTGLPRDSKAQAEQVRSISVERIAEAVGILPAALLVSLDEALRLHLGL